MSAMSSFCYIDAAFWIPGGDGSILGVVMIGVVGCYGDDSQYFMRAKDFNRLVWHSARVNAVGLMGTRFLSQYSVVIISGEAFDSIAVRPPTRRL